MAREEGNTLTVLGNLKIIAFNMNFNDRLGTFKSSVSCTLDRQFSRLQIINKTCSVSKLRYCYFFPHGSWLLSD